MDKVNKDTLTKAELHRVESAERSACAIKQMKTKNITNNVAKTALLSGFSALEYLMPYQITSEMLAYMNENCDRYLAYVYQDDQTEEMVTAEMLKDSYAFAFAAPKFLTYEMAMLGITESKVPRGSIILERLDPDLQTPELVEKCILESPYSIQYAKKANLTPNAIMSAIKYDACLIRYVGKRQQSVEICLEAMTHEENRWWFNKEWLSKNVRKDDTYKALLKLMS